MLGSLWQGTDPGGHKSQLSLLGSHEVPVTRPAALQVVEPAVVQLL
jgi:hypothetical protein